MTRRGNICEGCPAAYALGLHTDALAESDDSYMIEERRNEAAKARCALEEAAGQTACNSDSKELPPLPESIPPTGSEELINFVSQCPSFLKYLELRAAELGQ